MATFVLVHGAWSGGFAWTPVIPGLQAAGHRVFAPTLTGLADRSHLVGKDGLKGLDLHVEDVVAVLEWEELEDVILVGHSYGGMVISGAAARVPQRVRTLFYLDAFVPEDGQSLNDLVPFGQATVDAAAANGGMVAPRLHPPKVGSDFAQAYARRRRPQPIEHFTGKVKLSEGFAGIANRTYVYATQDTPTSFTRFYEAFRDDPRWRMHTVDTGHLVMVDDPETLTRLLLAEVDR